MSEGIETKAQKSDRIFCFVGKVEGGELIQDTLASNPKVALMGELNQMAPNLVYSKKQFTSLIEVFEKSPEYVVGFIMSNKFYYINPKYHRFFISGDTTDCIIASDLKDKCKREKLRRIKYGN